MTIPFQITFRGMEASPAIDAYVRRRADKLETFYNRITRCRVAVEVPNHRRRHGGTYRVRVGLTVPGAAIVLGHNPSEDRVNQDVYSAIDAAFDHVGRTLQDQVQRQRGDTKTHE